MSDVKAFLSLMLCALTVLSLISPCLLASDESVADLAHNSERFLSDFAVGSGGEVTVDESGSVVFRIKKTRHSLKFKCTGDSPVGEQNAICIWLNNLTGSSRMYVDIVFMRLDGEQYSVNYEKTVENSGSDVFLFVPSVPDEFVVSISIRAAGVGEGRFTVMGIWHCFYSFSESRTSTGIGSLTALRSLDGGGSVRIEGNVLHDITISSKDSTINVYRLLPGEELSDGLILDKEPCASSSMSRSFSFTVKNRTGADYASAYAVTVNRPDGGIEYIIEDKLYPTIGYERDGDGSFKGTCSTLEYAPSEMSSEALIIDVDISTFMSGTLKGYLYSFGGENYCFDSDTVDSISRRIASHTADGGEVYFRFVSAGDNGAGHLAVYDADGERAAALYAAVSFLCDHYGGEVNGIVIGEKLDTPYAYANVDGIKYTDYVRKYADLVSMTLLAGRNAAEGLKIVIPISSNNESSDENGFGSDKYPMFAMLISFLEVYSQASDGELCMMVCDSTFPYVGELLGKENVTREVTHQTKKEIMDLRAENAEVFEGFLDYLSQKYGVTDDGYFYMWHPFGTHTQEELSAAYIYDYFVLSSRERIYSFFCDFTPDERQGDFTKSALMSKAINEMGGIDADEYAERLMKESFGVSLSGIEGYDSFKPSSITVRQLTSRIGIPVGVKGSYRLTDFSAPSSLVNWKKGVYAEAISTDSAFGDGRSLRATLNLPANVSEYAEIIYSLDREVDMSSVDAVRFTLSLSGAGTDEDTDYSVRIAIGSESSKGVLVYEKRITPDEGFEVIADTTRFSGMNKISYIKISVQNSSGVSNRTFLHVGDVTLYSTRATDSQLSALFVEKDEERDDTVTGQGVSKKSTLMLILLGISATAIVAILVVMRSTSDDAE